MRDCRSYTGIDIFRLAAAFLVVAIHTSPLASCSETGDFILTRIAARVAVPFFLMTSGFFLISQYAYDSGVLLRFVKRLAVIYGAAILVCLPLNVYNGYFSMEHFLPNLIKDLLFDGTLYHLWYLPAAILGGVLAWLLVRAFGKKRAFAAALLLYAVGLFGDSYYGLIQGNAFLRGFYDNLFEVTDYTRNGIFFAPIFLVMGGMLADEEAKDGPRGNKGGWAFFTALFFALMFGEAMLLHRLGFPRHDSMYVFLLPCMYCLFRTLLFFRGRRVAALRTVSLFLYIIHPLVIVGVRLAARLLGAWELLVDNSPVHFLTVAVLSAVLSVALVWGKGRVEKYGARIVPSWGRKRSDEDRRRDRAWIQVDTEALRHNVAALQELLPKGCRLMAVVKANAYGHGACGVAVCLERMGVDAFGVATVDEGIALRRYGIQGEILILGYVSPQRAGELARFHLMPTLIDSGHAELLERQGVRLKAHLKVDTGMHRLGFDADETDRIAAALSLKHIRVTGIYTHLCAADSQREEDVAFSRRQIARFYGLLRRLADRGISVPAVHLQSSYGLLNYPELSCDYARIGIALYGVHSFAGAQTRQKPDLRPVLSLRSKVALLREIGAGESVGYGRTFTADRDSVIAVVPIGYGDGYPRSLSGGKSFVLIRGQRAPIVGRICMDQLTVDVTKLREVRVGDVVTLIGRDGEERIGAEELACGAESITNELLSRMGGRLSVTGIPLR